MEFCIHSFPCHSDKDCQGEENIEKKGRKEAREWTVGQQVMYETDRKTVEKEKKQQRNAPKVTVGNHNILATMNGLFFQREKLTKMKCSPTRPHRQNVAELASKFSSQ